MIWQTQFGKCIYESKSGYKVYQNALYRWLTLGSSAYQTVLNRKFPHRPVLHYLKGVTLMVRAEPDAYCVLGVGGAGIMHMLAQSHKNYAVTAVDISDEVIQIAQEYFGVKSLSNVTIVQQNALDFLRECKIVYKHILIDLYSANSFPADCATADFFNHCSNCIEEDGFISINLANLKEQWSFIHLIKNLFPNTLVIPVKHSANMIIIASKNKNKEWFLEKVSSIKEVKRVVWVPSWGNVAEIR